MLEILIGAGIFILVIPIFALVGYVTSRIFRFPAYSFADATMEGFLFLLMVFAFLMAFYVLGNYVANF